MSRSVLCILGLLVILCLLVILLEGRLKVILQMYVAVFDNLCCCTVFKIRGAYSCL